MGKANGIRASEAKGSRIGKPNREAVIGPKIRPYIGPKAKSNLCPAVCGALRGKIIQTFAEFWKNIHNICVFGSYC